MLDPDSWGVRGDPSTKGILWCDDPDQQCRTTKHWGNHFMLQDGKSWPRWRENEFRYHDDGRPERQARELVRKALEKKARKENAIEKTRT